jgi:hypothetical protein
MEIPNFGLLICPDNLKWIETEGGNSLKCKPPAEFGPIGPSVESNPKRRFGHSPISRIL